MLSLFYVIELYDLYSKNGLTGEEVCLGEAIHHCRMDALRATRQLTIKRREAGEKVRPTLYSIYLDIHVYTVHIIYYT